MVSSIGAYGTDIMQYLQISTTNTTDVQTTRGFSFDELIGNGKISENSSNDSSTGITAMAGMESSAGSSSSETYSEMDLNQDGVVTIDEIMRYTEMQMMEKMQEQLAEENSGETNSNDDEKKTNNEKFDVETFKTQMAAKAYQMGETMLTASIGAITQSFAV